MQGSFSNRRKLEQLGILLGIQTCSHMAKVNTKGAHDPKLNLKDSVAPHPKELAQGPAPRASGARYLLHLGPSQVPIWDLHVTQRPAHWSRSPSLGP